MMSWLVECLATIGSAVTEQEWRDATDHWVCQIKVACPAGIAFFGEFFMTTTLKTHHLPEMLRKHNGKFVENQFGEKVACRFDSGPLRIVIKESPYEQGARKARVDMKRRGLTIYGYWSNWKKIESECPFQPHTEQYRGWWESFGYTPIDNSELYRLVHPTY